MSNFSRGNFISYQLTKWENPINNSPPPPALTCFKIINCPPLDFLPNEFSANAGPSWFQNLIPIPILLGGGRHKLQGLRAQTRKAKSLKNETCQIYWKTPVSIILLEEEYICSNVFLHDHTNQFRDFSRHIFFLIFITPVLLFLHRSHFMRKLYHKKQFFRYDLLLHSRWSPSWIGKTFQPLYVKRDVYVNHVCFSGNH